jgi:hypothetical protein
MTGTNCDLFTHKYSRSYLNHLVHVIPANAVLGFHTLNAVFSASFLISTVLPHISFSLDTCLTIFCPLIGWATTREKGESS